MDLSKFGDRVRRARQSRRLTQSALARAAQLPDGTSVSRYERGEHEPGAEKLGALARALSVSMDWLAGDGDDPVPKPSDPPRDVLIVESDGEGDADIARDLIAAHDAEVA